MVVLIIQLIFFGTNIQLVSANIVSALVAVQTPITVIFGAILLPFFEVSGATDTLRKWTRSINPNPIAQAMIIGCLRFSIEGNEVALVRRRRFAQQF